MNDSMKGKTVVVTGANQGIGFAAALALASKGAKVVLWCRNETKGREAVATITKKGFAAELIVADVSSQASIRAAAAEFKSRHERLDVLVNNAGVLVPSRRTTIDGIEETFAVNHLGYFLVTQCLREVLESSGNARVVSVSSRAHRGGRMNWNDIQFTKGYSAFKVYAQSKLANILFTTELARRLSGTRVTANCLHPGVIASGFGHTYGGMTAALWGLARPFLKSNEDGARTTIYLASSAEVEGVTGKYFADCKVTDSTKASKDEADARRLWELSEAMTKASVSSK